MKQLLDQLFNISGGWKTKAEALAKENAILKEQIDNNPLKAENEALKSIIADATALIEAKITELS